jgi:hypothetical protein
MFEVFDFDTAVPRRLPDLPAFARFAAANRTGYVIIDPDRVTAIRKRPAAALKAALRYNGLPDAASLAALAEHRALRLPYVGPQVWAEAVLQAHEARMLRVS